MVEEFPDPEGRLPPLRRFKSFAPGYFETMGTPGGGALDHVERDPRAAAGHRHFRTARPAVLEEPAEALGKRVRRCNARMPWREIVGVVGDERDDGLNQPATAIVYWPMLNESYRWRTMAYAVRSDRVGAPGFLRELEQAVWSVDPNLPLAGMQTLEEIQAQIHGADVLCAGDARPLPQASRC